MASVKTMDYPEIGKVVIPYLVDGSGTTTKNQSFGYVKGNLTVADPYIISELESATEAGVTNSHITELLADMKGVAAVNESFYDWIQYIGGLSQHTYYMDQVHVDYDEILYDYIPDE